MILCFGTISSYANYPNVSDHKVNPNRYRNPINYDNAGTGPIVVAWSKCNIYQILVIRTRL